jgi:murein endopeptidase
MPAPAPTPEPAEPTREPTRARIATLQHRIAPGETLSAIAVHPRVSLERLLEENPGLEPDRIRAGALLTISSRAVSTSVSVGSPTKGRLHDGRTLRPGRGYVIRDRDRAFGTDEVIDALTESLAYTAKRHPRAPAIAVHDLSLRSGGPMTDHRSHQSGRDADLAYPRKHCAGTCEFERSGPAQLDADRAFTLLRHLLERDELEAVFIDYRLQAPLYQAARAQGASAEQLARWFQYPQSRGNPHGVIRHFPKHADHMHLRFRCHDSDPRCRSFRPLRVQTAKR